MSTRYLIAALLMTSACVARADVMSSQMAAAPQARTPVTKMVSYMAHPISLASAALAPSATVLASPTATPSAVSGPITVAATNVPEPSSIALMAAGMFGVMGLRRRTRR